MTDTSAAPTSGNAPASKPITHSLLLEAVAELYERVIALEAELAELKAAS